MKSVLYIVCNGAEQSICEVVCLLCVDKEEERRRSGSSDSMTSGLEWQIQDKVTLR